MASDHETLMTSREASPVVGVPAPVIDRWQVAVKYGLEAVARRGQSPVYRLSDLKKCARIYHERRAARIARRNPAA